MCHNNKKKKKKKKNNNNFQTNRPRCSRWKWFLVAESFNRALLEEIAFLKCTMSVLSWQFGNWYNALWKFRVKKFEIRGEFWLKARDNKRFQPIIQVLSAKNTSHYFYFIQYVHCVLYIVIWVEYLVGMIENHFFWLEIRINHKFDLDVG